MTSVDDRADAALIRELEPAVAGELTRHLDVAKDWFPAEEIFLSERHHAKGGGYDAQFRIPKYWADSLELDSWYNPSLLQPHSIDCCEWRAMINQQECFSGQLIFFLVLPPKLIEFLLIPT